MLINIDEVATGALVNALAVAGRRLSVAIGSMPRRRREHDLTVARWFSTYELTSRPPSLPEDLADVLRGDEVQSALHALLAARLTDAPEADAARAHEVLTLSLGPAPEAAALADYYDDEICTLVARLEADDPPLLAQIRNDAFNTRVIAILNAIERHTAALNNRPAPRTEASFLTSYRRHVAEQHGKLEPPDFDRRRRVPISDIYVPTTITKDIYSERTSAQHPVPESLNAWQLATELDRSVLLGDPGGGKTTAATVLMHHFASTADGRIPFLVTLRDYAAKDPPERSVVGHIDHTLTTFYQCPPPPGLVDLLLLTGRAVVIFDGLDELIDTSRRADVTARVEHFCAEYPLAPVLVTSRVIGYDQARLDDRHFTCYRLAGLADEQVAEFARKWFAQDPQARPEDPSAFVAETDSIPDLRSNPLMLALLCILYRGEGSLPRNRAEIYEQCATLLFRRWDARRHIHYNLRAGHLLEPTLRHLAWWLFTRDDAKSAVTEFDLVAETTMFLHGRGFESEDDARDAAREFVGLCRGRMWVFADAGTAAGGEKLYAFTHRTFLEYFAAARLAYDSDTPEHLARVLAPLTAKPGWATAAELALQIKDRSSTDGAQRIYATLLGDPSRKRDIEVLRFLVRCLRSADPSPGQVRELTRAVLEAAFAADRAYLCGIPLDSAYRSTLFDLIAGCEVYRETVAAQLVTTIADAIGSADRDAVVSGLRLAISVSSAFWSAVMFPGEAASFWATRAERLLQAHRTVMVSAAEADAYIRLAALTDGLITARQAMDKCGGPTALCEWGHDFLGVCDLEAYLERAYRALQAGWPAFGVSPVSDDLAAVGEYLRDHPDPPWVSGRFDLGAGRPRKTRAVRSVTGLSPDACLGAVAILCALTEQNAGVAWLHGRDDPGLAGPLRDLVPYLDRRRGLDPHAALPDLPVPDKFKPIFRDWAECRVDFIARNPG